MTDLKPPKSVDGERETLHALWQFQRESFVRKVSGISDDDARRRLVASDTTLLWLTKHFVFAESIWVLHRFVGSAEPLPSNVVTADDTIVGAIDAYRATWAVVDAVVQAADLDDRCADDGGEAPVNLRWILMHLLEETARHAGHADILRELIDDETGR